MNSADDKNERSAEVQEWLWHMDLHLTEHDLQHAGKALRAAWPHVSAYLTSVENERNTWRELAQKAESDKNWLRAQRDTAEEKLRDTRLSAIVPPAFVGADWSKTESWSVCTCGKSTREGPVSCETKDCPMNVPTDGGGA